MSQSLPSRERGLKYFDNGQLDFIGESLPSRERGLKLEWYRRLDFSESRSLHGSVD